MVTQLIIQVERLISWGKTCWSVKSTTHLQLVPRLRVTRYIYSYKPAWRGQGFTFLRVLGVRIVLNIICLCRCVLFYKLQAN